MGVTKWADMPHKASPARRAEVKREALAELDRIGYAALRKARELTQVELAETLGMSQAGVAGIESRTDLQLSTLAKYIRAMGGELEIRAVFPEATFNLEPIPRGESKRTMQTKPSTTRNARVAKAS